MYTVLENARIVISLLKKHNIRHIVLSPGGSNIPIVQGVQSDPFFKCYSVVDERSAMYFAIGLYLQTGEIVATSCTSAQATRNYVPGLTEAYYKRVPILAITMSKHPRFLGQDYMQCPIQDSLPVDAVKKSFSLPRIKDENDRALCVRMANEAILELTHNGNGPVQLDLQELDSETWLFDKNAQLPDVRKIERFSYYDKIDGDGLRDKKIMLVIGEHRPFTTEETQAIEQFCQTHNAFVYTDPTSNYHGRYALNANCFLAFCSDNLFFESYSPDVVVSIGGLTGDYALYFKLFRSAEGRYEHWRIDMDGAVVDTYNHLTRIYQMSVSDFFSRMQGKGEASHSYFDLWKKAYDEVAYDHVDEMPLSNLYAAIKLAPQIPDHSIMNYAILNSFRSWCYVKTNPTIQAYCNLAAFGIDGCTSTLLGESVATDQLSFLISGDLAFFYDLNAIGIRHIRNNVRILLCNNNGGMEFKFGNLQDSTDVGSYIAADNHFRNAEGWAKTNGFTYYKATTKEELDALLPTFVAESTAPIIIEIFTTPENERKASALHTARNMQYTKEEKAKRKCTEVIKDIVTPILGEEGVKIVKKFMN